MIRACHGSFLLALQAVARLRRNRRISFSFNLSPILNKSKSQFIYGDSSSSDDDDDDDEVNFSKYRAVNLAAVESRCCIRGRAVAVSSRAPDPPHGLQLHPLWHSV